MTADYFMKQAIELAKKGWPLVAPNPLVGCLIVYNDKVVAEGYHQAFGHPHAEVNAIAALPTELPVKDCVLYVSLEPCTHFGKTPPCADLIISKGFKKVVIATLDPNPLVAGSGVKKLKEAGIEVIVGVLEAEASDLNKRFFTFHTKKRPYIFLKWAQTADGFMSRMPIPKQREDNQISGFQAQRMVHQLRSEVMGICVGKNTVLHDNPHLTTRLAEGKNPIRLVIDSNLEIPKHFFIYHNEAPTMVFNSLKEGIEAHIEYVKIGKGPIEMTTFFNKLYEKKIQSVLVEGGLKVLSACIEADLWDEVLIFENPALYFHKGIPAPKFGLSVSPEHCGADKLYRSVKK